MIAYWPESKTDERARYEQFRIAIQEQCSDVRFAIVGDSILVVGTVSRYALKAAIDAEAQKQELVIQNCVRVVPGREWFVPDSFRIAG